MNRLTDEQVAWHSERLTDERVADYIDCPPSWTDSLAREVQQWRALIHQYGGQPSYIHPAQLDAIIAKLREASQ